MSVSAGGKLCVCVVMAMGIRNPMSFSPLGCGHKLNSIPAGFFNEINFIPVGFAGAGLFFKYPNPQTRGYNNVVGFWGVPTAGWRNAPAYFPGGSTRGSAKLLGQSSLGAGMPEHTDLEWFGPPERNTLRPLCGVLH